MNDEELLIKINENPHIPDIIEAVDRGLIDGGESRKILFDLSKSGNKSAIEAVNFIIDAVRTDIDELDDRGKGVIRDFRGYLDDYGIQWRDPTTLQKANEFAGKYINRPIEAAGRQLEKTAWSVPIGLSKLTADVGIGLPNAALWAAEKISGKETPRLPQADVYAQAEESGLPFSRPAAELSGILGSFGFPIARLPAALSMIPGFGKSAKAVGEGVATGSLYDAAFTASDPDADVGEGAIRGALTGGGTSAGMLGFASGANKLIQSIGRRSPEEIADLAKRLPESTDLNIAELSDSPLGRSTQIALESIPFSGGAGARDNFFNKLNKKSSKLSERLSRGESKDTISDNLSKSILGNYERFKQESASNYSDIAKIASKYPESRIPYRNNNASKAAKDILVDITSDPVASSQQDKLVKSVTSFLNKEELLSKISKGEFKSKDLKVVQNQLKLPEDVLQEVLSRHKKTTGRSLNGLNFQRATVNDEISSSIAKGDEFVVRNLKKIRKGIEKDIEKAESLIPDERIKGAIQSANKYYRDYVAPYSKSENLSINKIITGDKDTKHLRNALMSDDAVPILNHLNPSQKDKAAFLVISDKIKEGVSGDTITPSGITNAFNNMKKKNKEAIFGGNASELKEINLLKNIGNDTYDRASPIRTGYTGKNTTSFRSLATAVAALSGVVYSPQIAIPLAAAVVGSGSVLNKAMNSQKLKDAYLRQYVFRPDAYQEQVIPLASRINYILNEE